MNIKNLTSKLLITTFTFSILFIANPSIPVLADSFTVVTLGADLSDSQKNEMLKYFEVTNNDANIIEITSEEEGYVENLEVEKIGYASMLLGAGRAKKEDIIDPTVGIKFYLDVGSQVKKGDLIAEIFYNDTKNLDETIKTLKESIKLSKEEIIKEDIIYKIIK